MQELIDSGIAISINKLANCIDIVAFSDSSGQTTSSSNKYSGDQTQGCPIKYNLVGHY